MSDRCEPPEGAEDYPKWIRGDSLWVSPDRCLFHSYGDAKCGSADSFYACNRPTFSAHIRIEDDARAWLTDAARYFPEPVTPPAEVERLRADLARLVEAGEFMLQAGEKVCCGRGYSSAGLPREEECCCDPDYLLKGCDFAPLSEALAAIKERTP